MNPISAGPSGPTTFAPRSSAATSAAQAKDAQLRQTFDAFVGQTFYGQMLHAMRKTVGKPAYFYGGKGEEVFQQQLDQVVGEKLASANGSQLSAAMYKLFTMERK